MYALLLIFGLLCAPVALWAYDMPAAAGFAGLYVVLSLPSIYLVIRLAIKTKSLPVLAGGPGLSWAGKRYGSGAAK